MKKLHSNKITKQIVLIIAIIMLCNFVMPINLYAATDTESGSKMLPYIAKFLCFIPDSFNGFLQNLFTNPGKINKENEFKIYYSPAIIFSGKVPALDTDFFKDEDDNDDEHRIIDGKRYKNVLFTSSKGLEADVFYRGIRDNTDMLKNFLENDKYGYNDSSTTQIDITYIKEASTVINGKQFYDYTIIVPWKTAGGDGKDGYSLVIYGYAPDEFTERGGEEFVAYRVNVVLKEGIVEKEYVSSAIVLQPIVASWYRAFRRIALVGLLSVLLYIGIRIVLSSTSAENKAKYKKMLKDWIVALCILIMLHSIMHLTVIVVDEITDAISTNIVNPDGEDALMTTIRQKIGNGGEWKVVITEVVLYVVITIFTVIFTIQYIRRLVYLAFLTMIAPLITLTYPLDKIKDSKAQAFDTWIKDYVFFSLLQVVHLLLYYILVGSAFEMAEEGNWIYAIIMVGFLTKAEKIVKKMFGFDKSKSMGALGAAATGALVTNVLNKVKTAAKPKGGGSGGSKDSGGDKGGSKPARTAEKDPLAGLRNGQNNNGAAQNGGGTNGGVRPANNGTDARSVSARAQEAFGNNQTASQGENNSRTSETRSGANNNGNNAQGRRKVNRIRGALALTRRYVGPALRTLGAGATAAVGGTIGFAAGVAQGDIGKALGGAAGGLAAGYYTGQRAIRGAGSLARGVAHIDRPIRNAIDTYRRGAGIDREENSNEEE